MFTGNVDAGFPAPIPVDDSSKPERVSFSRELPSTHILDFLHEIRWLESPFLYTRL
jgi:hypothetical protein